MLPSLINYLVTYWKKTCMRQGEAISSGATKDTEKVTCNSVSNSLSSDKTEERLQFTYSEANTTV